MLSPFAAFSDRTRGRERTRPQDPYRTDYQRDRERILHCKSFRRLMHKTQVFIAPEGDHYRTRMTHTLEVAQIARSIARSLGLNEDLTEAIALGHDLGHTPFGHTGESALDACLQRLGADTRTAARYPGAPARYRHAVQSLRVVERLEYGGKGLNLCWETRDGILGHSGQHIPQTLEGQIVRTADRIAYINHDIDDAERAGVLTEEQLPPDACAVLGHTSNERITTLVHDMTESSAGQPEICMSPAIERAMLDLRSFLFHEVYESPRAKADEPKAERLVEELFTWYLEHPAEMPPEYLEQADGEPVQATVDFVAGMTDRYALREYRRIFVPASWSL